MKMLINGEHRDSSDLKTIAIFNPVNNQFVDSVPAATSTDVDFALECANSGQKKWAAIPLKDKKKIFDRFIYSLEENKYKIIETHMRESGFSIRNCLFQFQGIADLFEGYLESAKRLNGTILVPGTEQGHDGRTENDLQMVVHEPLGIVLAIIPFNAPMMLFSYKVASALSVGNAVIVKPPSTNPLAVIMLTELLWEAGVPGDALQVITGQGAIVGDYLVNDPRINAVSLTGSTTVGINIATTMAKRLSPFMLELGGNDPYIVMPDVNVEKAAREGIRWRMNSAGQVCISPKRFIVHNSVIQEFTDIALDIARDIELGFDVDAGEEISKYIGHEFSDFKPGSMKMNPLITEKAALDVEEQVNHTIQQGAKLLYGGHRHGAFFEPTIIGGVTKEMDIAKDLEIFGPVAPIIGFDTVEEAIEIANSSIFGLSGCVLTNDWKLGMNVAQKIESGTVVVNGVGMYRNMMQPFGGYKMSGVGQEGFTAIEEMTKKKTIILKDFLKN
ncbi:MAG: aldehyde dehydrogenase family protein [Anaerolineaceae bacterium]